MVLLLTDDFYETAQSELSASGYLLTLVQRHERTVVQGTTPKGIAFRYQVDSSGWSLTYRNKAVRSGLAPLDWWSSTRVRLDLTAAVAAAGG